MPITSRILKASPPVGPLWMLYDLLKKPVLAEGRDARNIFLIVWKRFPACSEDVSYKCVEQRIRKYVGI